MTGILLQIICAMMGGSAIVLVGCKRHSIYRWGYVIGCLNAPVWIFLEIWYAQYFLLPINILYVTGWLIGLKNHWRY